MTERGADYALSVTAADWLSGTIQLPADLRRMSLAKFGERYGADAVIEAFAQYLGLSSSVVANCAEMVSIDRIAAGLEHPENDRSRLNLPTPFGALRGVVLAAKASSAARCKTCAFRLGTIANQSPITTGDADWCGHPGEADFMCHEGVAEGEEPTKACAGWAELRKERAA